MDLKNSKSNITGVLASLLAVLYPFFNYYGYGFITLSFLLSLLLFIYTIKKKGHFDIVQPIAMTLYVLYFCCTRVLSNLTSLQSIIAPSIIFIFLLGGFLNKEVVLNYFLKFYRIIAFINIAFLLLQEVLYNTLGYRVIGILSFLPLTNIGGVDFDASQYTENAAVAGRSSAFFSEPAHFVQFLLPLLVVELFFVHSRMAYVRSCMYVAALFILASGNAILGLGVIGLFLFLHMLRRMNMLKSIAVVVVFVSIMCLSISWIMTTEYGEKLLDRTEELDPNQSVASSGFLRIFRGYFIWEEMSVYEKTIGLNSLKKLDIKINSSPVASTFNEDDYYMNSVQSIMIFTGYIGVLIFVGLLVYLWRGNNLAGRCSIVVYVALSFIASIYFTYTMVLYLLVAFLMKKETSTPKMRTLTLRFV